MEKIVTNDQQIWQLARRHPIFDGIPDDDLRKVLPFFRVVFTQSGQTLIEEGLDHGTDLYLILEGKLEVMKRTDTPSSVDDHRFPEQFVIAQINAGDSIGELSFVKGEGRSASVKSLTNAMLLGLSPLDLLRLEGQNPGMSSRIMKNMVGYVGDRLKRTSDNEVRALKLELQNSIEKSNANLFFSYVICLLCVYNVTLRLTATYATDVNGSSLVSALIVIVFSGVLYLMTRKSRLPLRKYGLTMRNWRPAVKESLAWSAIVIVGLIAAKWTLIHTVERYKDLTLFDFDLGRRYIVFNFLLYGLHCPIQEFVARGVLQSSLSRFFTSGNTTLRAILVSNALFSAVHIHVMSGLLAIVVFVPGLLWGWLYSRHPTLIGVSISHLLIGWTALFFLNFESLF